MDYDPTCIEAEKTLDFERIARKYADAEGANERSDFVEHAQRVQGLVEAYAGKLIHPLAIKAVMLHDIADRLYPSSIKHTPERAAAAKNALLDVFADPKLSEQEGNYLASLLADLVKTENASGKHRKDMAESANGDVEGLVEMISTSYTGKIPTEAWAKTEPLLDFDHMRRFAKSVNLEAIIIKSCELLDNMRHPSSLRESAQLQDILESESFYAPIVEALGLEGLASSLRGEAHKIRLSKQGKDECIGRASELLQNIDEIGMQNITRQVFGSNDSRIVLSPSVMADSFSGSRPFEIGEFAVEIGKAEDRRIISGNYRLKGEGSLADKIDKYQGDLPMDLVGLMVISKDEEQSAKDFAEFIATMVNTFKLKPARSKEKAIYIQGDKGYVEMIKGQLKEAGIDEAVCQIEVQPESGSDDSIEQLGYKKYQVSKVTFMMDDDGGEIPIEVQFVTKEERKRSRLGEVAHIIYKYLSQFPDISNEDKKKIIDSAVETLTDLYDRKKHLSCSKLGVNERSIPGGNELISMIV